MLLSTLGADTPIWVLGCWFAVLGIGFGTSMQLLVVVAGVLLCLVVEKPLATTIAWKSDPAPSDPAATAST
ncbi:MULTISPECIES: hypothetical protein [Rhodococcus]|uniref:hypothetical protein n=1 Tax=Rhodococcus TaxID=1827 RepID=UPI001E460673|nr:hypothetical protein [Rhodococcus pyridinivorans]MCD2117112.1 hypothetical protein [Rhodococcus pyridinivorans]MCZ4626233.1 hypothetical protein [Rhodococcus pyridinivorans]MCZ4647188.1 hypothetical protein [Rhodococcus pyridinivorans]MDJ0481933.1 hypothetical protein [Rhodococcus pyridinivorans]MDV7253291.1 hypothetical protein [Rhodococcus pyridinivorans]